MNQSKGFTIIELLVVVAIIALLASIILINVNAIRAQAADSKTKSQMSSLRAAAESYYNDNGNNYGLDTTAAMDCATGGMAADTGDSGFPGLVAASAYSDGILPTCTTDAVDGVSVATQWSAYKQLKASTNYFCVDSKGTAEEPPTWTAPVNGGPCP